MEVKVDTVRGVWVDSTKSIHNVMVKLNTNDETLKLNSIDSISIDSTECKCNVDKEICDTNSTECKSTAREETEQSNKTPLFNIIYKYKPTKLAKYFWYIVSFSNIITADVNVDVIATDLEFSTFDACVMFISTYLLLQGFEKGKPMFALIWMVTFFWGLYTCQYLSLVQLVRTISYTEDDVNPYMWLAFSANIFCLGLRFILWIKVLDFLFGTELLRFTVYWLEVIGYMSKRITTVRTLIPKQII